MNFINKLNEAISKNYYDMNIVDVASDFPEILTRIMFKEIEKTGIKIATKDKTDYIHEIRRSLEEKRNPFLKSDYPNQLGFEDQKTGKGVEIKLNFLGNKAKLGLNVDHIGPTEAPLMNVEKMSTKEFFNKIMNKLSVLMKIDRHSYYKTDKEPEVYKDPELFEQDPEMINTIKRIVDKYNLSAFKDKGYREGVTFLKIRPNYFPDVSEISGYNAPYNIDDFTYSFQLEQLKKPISYLFKSLINKGYYIEHARIDNHEFVIDFAYVGEKMNNQHPRYQKSMTYKDVSNTYIKSSLKSLEEAIDKSEKMSYTDFKRMVVKDILEKKNK